MTPKFKTGDIVTHNLDLKKRKMIIKDNGRPDGLLSMKYLDGSRPVQIQFIHPSHLKNVSAGGDSRTPQH